MQCWVFLIAIFWSSLAYESTEQKPKHCLTWDFLSALIIFPVCASAVRNKKSRRLNQCALLLSSWGEETGLELPQYKTSQTSDRKAINGWGSSNSVGGAINLDFMRGTRAMGLSYLSLKSPKLPKVGQIRSETSLNNMPFHPQMYCNVQIFTYEVAWFEIWRPRGQGRRVANRDT